MAQYDDLQNRFTYHPPTPARAQDHDLVRNSLLSVADMLSTFIPVGREHSLFLTKIEEAMFWANAAIARQK